MSRAIKFISPRQASYFQPEAIAHVERLIDAVPTMHGQDDDEDHMAFLHYINHKTKSHWLVTELDKETMTGFGWVKGLGYTALDINAILAVPDTGLDTRFKPVLVAVASTAI